MDPFLDRARLAVLTRYGCTGEGLRWISLGTGGGFSGATLWRGDDDSGTAIFALKAWPPDGTTEEGLRRIHAWMAGAAHLAFVPAVLPARDGSTVVWEAGRLWDVTRWLPGRAADRPNREQLVNACGALAQLHRAWKPSTPRFAAFPAIQRRLRVLADWRTRRAVLSSPPASGDSRLDEAIRRGVATATRFAASAEFALQPWASQMVPVQPCLCDVHRDHVLFLGNAVSGVVDYGAVKWDHVAVDLARLLGDFAAEDDGAFQAGLEAYRAAGGRCDLPDAAVRLLDLSGTLGGIIVWLLRLLGPPRRDCDLPAVAERLDRLVGRLDARIDSAAFPR